MQYFCMDGLYMDMGSSGIFGGIFRAMEIGFPFVSGRKGLKGSDNQGQGFRGKNRSTKIITGIGVVRGFLGNFEKAISKSIHRQRFEKILLGKREKSFSGVIKHY